MKFCTGDFYSELCIKFKFVSDWTKITVTLLEDVCDLMTSSLCILRELRKFYNKHSRENQNTPFVSHIFFRGLRHLQHNFKKCKRTREVIAYIQRFVVVYLVFVLLSHIPIQLCIISVCALNV